MAGSQKRYCEKNKARIRIRKREYYLKNKSRILAKTRERYRYRTEKIKQWMPERVNRAGTFAGTHENSRKNIKKGKEED